MNIGIAIRTVRINVGLSQEELSEKAAISQTSISQIENGRKTPSKKTIQKICSVLEVPEAVLYIIGIEASDVPPGRQKIFEELYPTVKDIVIQILGKRNSKLLSKSG